MVVMRAIICTTAQHIRRQGFISTGIWTKAAWGTILGFYKGEDGGTRGGRRRGSTAASGREIVTLKRILTHPGDVVLVWATLTR